jgi:hypothetical protein
MNFRLKVINLPTQQVFSKKLISVFLSLIASNIFLVLLLPKAHYLRFLDGVRYRMSNKRIRLNLSLCT